jgi:hypothetical protein
MPKKVQKRSTRKNPAPATTEIFEPTETEIFEPETMETSEPTVTENIEPTIEVSETVETEVLELEETPILEFEEIEGFGPEKLKNKKQLISREFNAPVAVSKPSVEFSIDEIVRNVRDYKYKKFAAGAESISEYFKITKDAVDQGLMYTACENLDKVDEIFNNKQLTGIVVLDDNNKERVLFCAYYRLLPEEFELHFMFTLYQGDKRNLMQKTFNWFSKIDGLFNRRKLTFNTDLGIMTEKMLVFVRDAAAAIEGQEKQETVSSVDASELRTSEKPSASSSVETQNSKPS